MAIDWTRGYSATWRLHEVNRRTWTDGDRLAGVHEATVERTDEGDAPEVESSSVTIDQPMSGDFRERFLRLVMVAEQDGARERVNVCTQLFAATSATTQRGYRASSLSGRSVLHTAATRKTWLAYRPYLPRGADGPTEVAEMLRACVVAPVEVTGAFEVTEDYNFDRAESVLESAWAVLRAGGHRIRVDGRGRVHVEPVPTDPALALSSDNLRLLAPEVSETRDWADVPNVYTADSGTETATATNASATSPVSTVSRGYVVDEYDSTPVLVNGETLEAYAERRLREMSVVTDARQWEREWWPDVGPGDLIRATLASRGIEGDYRVRRQSLACGAGIVVTEQAERSVSLWQS